jgi:hypothetical protein
MSEKIKILQIKKGPGVHFIRPTPTPDDQHRVTIVAKSKGLERVVMSLSLVRESGYLYYLDKDGDIARMADTRVYPKKTHLLMPFETANAQKAKNKQQKVADCVTKTQAPKRKDYVALIIDNSASMRPIKQAAEVAFNNVLSSICAGASDTQEIVVSVWSFGTEISALHPWTALSKKRPSISRYSPSENGTRLFDAVERVLNTTDTLQNIDHDASFVVTVVTDGHNNMGNVSASDFRRIIDKYQKTDKYTLTFMLPKGSKKAFCSNTGVESGNVDEWEQTFAGAETVSTSTSAGFNHYWKQRSAGTRSVKTFYTADASHITTSDLIKMTPITNEVSRFVAQKEERLREFCEKMTGRSLLRGAAFYQLIKAEKNVQANKKILIKDRSTGHVYCGRDARVLLGLPTDTDVPVKPGIHSNFDIYIQSTSVNRIIPCGSSVMYWPAAGVPYTEGPSSH